MMIFGRGSSPPTDKLIRGDILSNVREFVANPRELLSNVRDERMYMLDTLSNSRDRL